jgi:hypothetical protein
MTSEKICFPGAQQAPIEQFYAKKNPAQPVTDDTQQVMASIREAKGKLLECLQRVNNSAGAIAELRTVAFVTEATAAFARFEKPEVLAKMLGCVIDSAELIDAFLKSGGLKAISDLLKSPNPEVVIAVLPLVRIAAGGSPPDNVKTLISELLAADQWDCALELIENYNISAKTVVEPVLSQIMIASDSSDRCCQLILLAAEIDQLPVGQITPRLAIAAKNVAFIEKLIESDRFLSKLNEAAASVVTDGLSGDAETKFCAARIASMMPIAFIEKLMELINELDFPEMCHLLLPLSQGRNGAEAVLRHIGCLHKKVGTVPALKVFAEVAGFFSTECLEIPWLIGSLSTH